MPDPISPVYRYRATAIDVHDGDTYRLVVDLGFKVAVTIQCRIHGVDSPELNTPEGKAARDYARAMLTPAGEPPTPLVIESYKDARSFERWVCDVYVVTTTGVVSLADELLSTGHAVPMDR